MKVETCITYDGETVADRQEKNDKGMSKLLALIARNPELSLKDIKWARDHSDATDEEIAEYLKSRTEKDSEEEY